MTGDDVAGYSLSDAITLLWLEDGDHHLKPRKKLTGYTVADHLTTMAGTAMAWAEELSVGHS